MGKEGEDGQSKGGTEEEKESIHRQTGLLESRGQEKKTGEKWESERLSEGEFDPNIGLTSTTDAPTPPPNTQRVTKDMVPMEQNGD